MFLFALDFLKTVKVPQSSLTFLFLGKFAEATYIKETHRVGFSAAPAGFSENSVEIGYGRNEMGT